MNLEEAKANIGKEVIYVGKNKDVISAFSGKKLIISYPTKNMKTNVLIEYDELCFWNIPPQDLKLKEQPMNYKIKVTPETSAEVQELFFELGFIWSDGDKATYINKDMKFIFADDEGLFFRELHDELPKGEYKEITLPQLRDMVVLKRNDVNDATHIGRSGSYYYHGYKDYLFYGNRWMKVTLDDLSNLTKIKKESEMTWQDALRAVIDGKDVEVTNVSWRNINTLTLGQIKKGEYFRIKPQTIPIIGGDYTKEELLKIAGEMK